MTSRAVLCLTAAISVAPAVHAEPIYVIEQLVVNIASVPGGEGERIGQVKSGDKLELIERQGDEAHVRLGSGKEGWVKASYLSAEEPLTHKLGERVVEIEKLKQDITRLESEVAAARVVHNTPAVPAAAAAPAPQPVQAAAPVNAPVRETVFLREPYRPAQTSPAVLLGIAALMLLVGFVIGWKTLDRRIRHKYGGLRIY